MSASVPEGVSRCRDGPASKKIGTAITTLIWGTTNAVSTGKRMTTCASPARIVAALSSRSPNVARTASTIFPRKKSHRPANRFGSGSASWRVYTSCIAGSSGREFVGQRLASLKSPGLLDERARVCGERVCAGESKGLTIAVAEVERTDLVDGGRGHARTSDLINRGVVLGRDRCNRGQCRVTDGRVEEQAADDGRPDMRRERDQHVPRDRPLQ